ncbi:MAG: tetratricopeptide repeat protein [Vampirovibrionales bacterium]|nr:tetratricopeptide repeat protein [Vampirovibrionales bacterium]
MQPSSLLFIQPQILNRLRAGEFVAKRQQKPEHFLKSSHGHSPHADRRNRLSPLTITKRCIHYDPRVFEDRIDEVLQLAEDLNTPDVKVIMLLGAQGSGKTSLVRGLVELMGGGDEQLLWFDAHRATDFDDITQFLVQYIAYLSRTFQNRPFSSASGQKPFTISAFNAEAINQKPSENDASGFNQIEALMTAMADVPLLIVLDNLEYVVDGQLKLNSPAFKTLLNFLLQFDNVKMILTGERLPYADLAPQLLSLHTSEKPSSQESNAFSLHQPQAGTRGPENERHIDEIKLHGLSQPSLKNWVNKKLSAKQDHDSAVSPEDIQALYRLTQGYPWLVKTFLYFHQKAGIPIQALLGQLEPVQLKEAQSREVLFSPVDTLAELIYHNLKPIHLQAAQLMVLVRHPVDTAILFEMLSTCHPLSNPQELNEALLHLEQSLLRPVLKINYPPQEVLQFLQESANTSVFSSSGEDEKAFLPSYDLYHAVKKVFYKLIPDFEKIRLHEALQAYYTEAIHQAGVNTKRNDRLKNKTISVEAHFHSQMARKQVQNTSTPTGEAPAEVSDVITLQPRYPINDYGRARSLRQDQDLAEPIGYIDAGKTRSVEHLPDEGKTLYAVNVHDQSATDDISWEGLLSADEKRLLGLGEHDFRLKDTEQVQPIIENNLAIPTEVLAEVLDSDDIALDNPALGGPHVTASLFETGTPEAITLKNIQGRLALAVSNRNKPELLRQLIALSCFWSEQKYFERAQACLEKALTIDRLELSNPDAMPDPVPAVLLCEIWYQKGLLHQQQYQIQRAELCLAEAKLYIDSCLDQLAQKMESGLQQPHLAAEEYHLAGLVAQALCRLILEHKNQSTDTQNPDEPLAIATSHQEQAVLYLSAALGSLEKQGTLPAMILSWQKELAEAYFRLATCYDHRQDFPASINAYKDSLEQHRQTLINLQKENGQARDYKSEKQERQQLEAMAASANNIGQLYAELGQFQNAITWLEEGLSYDEKSLIIDAAIETLETIALVYENWHEHLLETSESGGNDEAGRLASLVNKAQAALEKGLDLVDVAEQNSQAQPSHSMATLLGNPHVINANLYLKLGNLFARQHPENSQAAAKAAQYYTLAKEAGQGVLSTESLAYLDTCLQNVMP